MMGHSTKKSFSIQNYEVSGILSTLKLAVNHAKCKLTTLTTLFSKPAKLEMEQSSSKATKWNLYDGGSDRTNQSYIYDYKEAKYILLIDF